MAYYTLAELERIASLLPAPITLKVTATCWADLADEIEGMTFDDPTKKPSPKNFKALTLRAKHCLTVVNSGHDNDKVLDRVNRQEEERVQFRQWCEKIAVAPKFKKEIEAEGPEENNAPPPKEMVEEAWAKRKEWLVKVGAKIPQLSEL
jgi:hypothetical protein